MDNKEKKGRVLSVFTVSLHTKCKDAKNTIFFKKDILMLQQNRVGLCPQSITSRAFLLFPEL